MISTIYTDANHRFGIEFAPEVVQADGNVRNLAWRVCNAKKVLVSPWKCFESRMN